VLSPRSAFVLGRPEDSTHVEIALHFPRVAALDGGTTKVLIDGEHRETVEMAAGSPIVRVPLGPAQPGLPLVEVVLESDRYYTEPRHAQIDGVFGYAPKSGKLIRSGIE
jgi:hypothetical protein